jgi:hypothetical protein
VTGPCLKLRDGRGAGWPSLCAASTFLFAARHRDGFASS